MAGKQYWWAEAFMVLGPTWQKTVMAMDDKTKTWLGSQSLRTFAFPFCFIVPHLRLCLILKCAPIILPNREKRKFWISTWDLAHSHQKARGKAYSLLLPLTWNQTPLILSPTSHHQDSASLCHQVLMQSVLISENLNTWVELYQLHMIWIM